MPITNSAVSPTQSNPFSALAGSLTNPNTNMPGLNFQTVQSQPKNVDISQANPQGVLNTLGQGAPQSLTALLMPLFQQLFGAQQGSLQQQFGLQSEQGVAQAQSDAMKRGLTGSSIESSGIQSALANANTGYNQAYTGLLGSLINSYSSAAGQDIGNQTAYNQSIAQALGQTYSSNIQQQQFAQQLQAGIDAANKQANATMWGGIAGGVGSLGGGALSAFL